MIFIIVILFLLLFAILGYKKPGVAVLTMPVVCLVLVYAGVWADFLAAVISAPFIFVVTLIAVLISRREPEYEEWPQKCAKCLLIGLMFCLFFAAAFALFGAGGIFGLVLFVLFVGAVISYGLASRHATAAYVISTIGASIRQNLPLPMALDSAASGRTDKRSRILRSIEKWLVQGYCLSESIKRGYPKCPGYAVGMIAAAERIDQLPQAIAGIEADMVARADEKKKLRPLHPLYPIILMSFVFFIVWSLTKFVVPNLSAVLTDLEEGAKLPGSTRFLMWITSFIHYGYGWLVWLVLGLAVLVVVVVSIRVRFRPRRPAKPYLISRIGDFVKWHLPIVHWFERNYSLVQVTELLQLSLNAGCTVNGAIANTLNLDVNDCFRKGLRRWLAKVEAGEDVATSAKQCGLGNTLAWAFDQRVNPGSTLTVLEMLASFYRTNYSYRVNLARFIMWPCVTIIMGLVVGFVVYAFFSPLIWIINEMTNLVYP
jgi:type II secretory pathway component PulF